ncbi:response regulator transcription factor [Nocardioides sp.]|uniref:response regulator transcription factor n=1 Tax=Nocardioides sp. TaxID=35761 RepID=UPI0031FF015B|nr:DNA-binding response regulator, OmpR family, contains and winged-helix domain [Nocardioides sp.]
MRILMVEDDGHVAAAVKRGLEAEGYAVDIALDGTDGHWLATENDYDVIVLDSMLPGMSGEALCRDLRERGDWTPILILTARTGSEPEVRALDSGADDFLSKPFSYAVLLARIRALLRRGREERPTILQAGDLRLDPASHQVWRGEVTVELTPRQFGLLECLMRHPGEALSKASLKEHLWDFAYDGDLNIIEVYVRQLRQRIDEPFGRQTIHTIRGVGYRLDPAGG